MRTLWCVAVVLLGFAPVRGAAQSRWGSAVRVVGSGDETWVFLSGVVGGTVGFRALEQSLLRSVADSALTASARQATTPVALRIVTVDAYQLSLDSLDVSYEALARRVRSVLDELGVRRAHVVGHAHGAGVALRLAAYDADRVNSLVFLDAGALRLNRSKTLSRSVRFVSLFARVPVVRGRIRAKLVDGIRENMAQSQWFDIPAQARYVDPMMQDFKRAIALAIRLNESTERDSLPVVVARVRAPVTVILGDAPHATSSTPEQIDMLTPLGARLLVVRLPAVGHFPHEEATARVTELLMRARQMRDPY